MNDEDTFLSRWSKRKHASKRGEPELPAAAAPPDAVPAAAPVEPEPAEALPPLETLTPESDYTPFLREGVDEQVKREALKTLFQDPRFNVMDGLDVYIDDFSKPDPLPDGWLEKMNQVAWLGDRGQPTPDAPAAPSGTEALEPPAEPAREALSQAEEGPDSETPAGVIPRRECPPAEVSRSDTSTSTPPLLPVPESGDPGPL